MPTFLAETLAVALGGAIGSATRFWVGRAAILWLGVGAWQATIGINVVGSLVIGLAAATPGSDITRFFVLAGLCGGFTTFSAFSLQTLELLREGALAKAGLNVVASVAICLAAVTAGVAIGARLSGTAR